MFLEGIDEISSIDILFYVSPDTVIEPSAVSVLERSFFDNWKIKLTIFICARTEVDKSGVLSKLWYYYVAGVFSFFKQTRFIEFSNPRQVTALESCLLRKPDAIFVHKLHSMCPLLLTKVKLPTVYMDLDDIEHVVFKRNISQFSESYKKVLKYCQLPMFISGERRAMRLARNTFVCSDIDRDYLTNHSRLPGIVTVPNAIAIPEHQDLTLEPRVLFIGTYEYKPNVDAAEYLITAIWPRIIEAIPSAKLIIAGAHPEYIQSYSNKDDSITFTGYVNNLELLYQQVRIVCTPIFVGGGTRVKIIEAAAFGKPVVSTTLGAEGLSFNNGTEIILRDDSSSIIESLLLMLQDHAICSKVGTAARKKAIELYDKNNIVKLISNLLTT